MNAEFPDDFSVVERRLLERHVPQAFDGLRSRVLGAVVSELEAKRDARRDGVWPYAAMAACLLLGLGLAQAAAVTSLIPGSASQRQEAVVSAATLRRLCPELSEDDARQLAPLVSLPHAAIALPVLEADSSPVRRDLNGRNVIGGESK